MKPKRKPGHWNDRERRVHRRSDHCGRNDCACEVRGLDYDVNEVPRRLSADDLRELGVQL